MKKNISVAIDGPSAAGKSTIAKMVAKKENFIYIDTGAMYRCVAYYCLTQKIDLNDEKAVEQAIEHIQIRLTPDNKVYLNDEDVSNQIRQDQVSLGASCVSKYQVVRSFLVDEQRKMAKAGNVILDGRDIGTVVLPNADLKIYQIASVETRAKRRYLENLERGLDADLETIKKEIEQRDYQDISFAQQARGIDMSKKEKLTKRIKNSASILMPLIFSSLDRIEAISSAMELRAFGSNKKRTWYNGRPFKLGDYITILVVSIILIIAIMATISNGGRFYNPFI